MKKKFFFWLDDDQYDRTEVNNCKKSTVNLFEKNWFGDISFVVDVGSSCSCKFRWSFWWDFKLQWSENNFPHMSHLWSFRPWNTEKLYSWNKTPKVTNLYELINDFSD